MKHQVQQPHGAQQDNGFIPLQQPQRIRPHHGAGYDQADDPRHPCSLEEQRHGHESTMASANTITGFWMGNRSSSVALVRTAIIPLYLPRSLSTLCITLRSALSITSAILPCAVSNAPSTLPIAVSRPASSWFSVADTQA